MTNQQLYLAIGVPSLLALANLVIVPVGFLLQGRNIDSRFDQFDKRFDQYDKRLDQNDSRFDRLESKLDRIDTVLHEIHLMLGRHDARLDALEKEKHEMPAPPGSKPPRQRRRSF